MAGRDRSIPLPQSGVPPPDRRATQQAVLTRDAGLSDAHRCAQKRTSIPFEHRPPERDNAAAEGDGGGSG